MISCIPRKGGYKGVQCAQYFVFLSRRPSPAPNRHESWHPPANAGGLDVRWVGAAAGGTAFGPSFALALLFSATLISVAAAQTTVNVNAGQTLGEQQLSNGSFGGMSFSLVPSTTFNINNGGTIGPLGFSFDPFDMGGATVSINSGGTYATQTQNAVSHVVLNVFEGGLVDDILHVLTSTVNVAGGHINDQFMATDGSTVNISSGSVGSFFEVVDSTVHITGGFVGFGFEAHSGSTVNLSGGSVYSFEAFTGSTANITGGNMGHNSDAYSGSDVTLVGGEFRLNGEAFAGTSITLAPGTTDVFSGTLVEESVFIFSPLPGDSLSAVTLNAATLPTPITTPLVVDSTGGPAPRGLRLGQSLTLLDGGALGRKFAAVGATLNIEGGTVDEGLEVFDTKVNISGGTVGRFIDVFSGSTVNITGGDVGFDFVAFSGSTVNISGGNLGGNFDARAGSTVNMSGGSSSLNNEAFAGSTVNISGGNVGSNFNAHSGTNVTLIGGEFRLNGEVFVEPNISLAVGTTDVFTGTLADGSVFIFSPSVGDSLSAVTLSAGDVAGIRHHADRCRRRRWARARGLRMGQSLTLLEGSAAGKEFCRRGRDAQHRRRNGQSGPGGV